MSFSCRVHRDRIEQDACLDRMLPDTWHFQSANSPGVYYVKQLRDITISELNEIQLGLLLLGSPWFGLEAVLDFYHNDTLTIDQLREPIVNAIRNEFELDPHILEICQDYVNRFGIEVDNVQNETVLETEIGSVTIPEHSSYSSNALFSTSSIERVLQSNTCNYELNNDGIHWIRITQGVN